MAQGKIIIGEPVGGVPSKKQFNNWAWNSEGSTMADYRKDVVKVYTEFTVKCLRDYMSLDMLSSVEDASEKLQKELPSWVPDWTVATKRIQLLALTAENYYTSGKSSAGVQWDPAKPNILGLEGHPTGTIHWLASEESARVKMVKFHHVMGWEAAVSNLPEAYPRGSSTFEAYWRTMIGEFIGHDDSAITPAPEEFRKYYQSFITFLEINHASETGNRDNVDAVLVKRNLTKKDTEKLLLEQATFFEELGRIMSQRRLCTLQEGLIGAVPLSTEIGDQIFVLKGGNVPFVLRATEEGQYQFIGECYVHGIMRGEMESQLDWRPMQIV